MESLKAKETPVSRIEYNTIPNINYLSVFAMGSLLAYVLNFDISVCMAMGVERSIIGGGGGRSSYSYIRVLRHSLLLKLIVFTVCEH